jgi:N,N'-diacetyllegionaminate synthase
MVSGIRNIEKALGDGVKKPSKSEAPNIAVARKSIVASKTIKKGETLDISNLAIKRPGDGISPMQFDEVVGMIATKDYQEDEIIQMQ